MSIAGEEYVIAPWGTGDSETEIVTIELPSRECVVQLETPTSVLENMVDVSDYHGITLEQALAERLEINRARMSLMAARSVEDTARIQTHLTEAREYLTGVEHLDTDEVEAEITEIWNQVLDSV